MSFCCAIYFSYGRTQLPPVPFTPLLRENVMSWSYTHTEESPEKVKELLQKQQAANSEHFPKEVLAAVEAAIDAFPKREPAKTDAGKEVADDGLRYQVTTYGHFDPKNP